MFNKFWQYLTGGLAALAGILGAGFLIMGNQRDRAREAAQDAKDGLRAVKETQSKERDIQDAQAEAREQSAEVQREHEDRPADIRPTGTFRR